MREWVIYKHTSTINGKCYIGQTCRSITVRWEEHLKDAHADRYHSHFHRAIRLYGIHAWKHEVLASAISSREEANRLECYFIREFNTVEQGYNLTSGGSFGVSSKLDNEYGVITLTHEFKADVTGVVSAIAEQLALHPANIMKVLTRKRTHTNGWTLPDVCNKNRIYLQDVPFIFKNRSTGDTFSGTAVELKHKYDLPCIMNLRNILNPLQPRSTMYGWGVVADAESAVATNTTGSITVYKYTEDLEFVEKFSSSLLAACSVGVATEGPVYVRCTNNIVSSVYKGFRWSFLSPEEVALKLATLGPVIVLHHRGTLRKFNHVDGLEFIGTARAFSKHINISESVVSKLVNTNSKVCMGWSHVSKLKQ